jgi:succinate dehydrogenase/fumarate reductase flavoprotein subunit
MREFTERYGVREDGRYVLARDLATYAIIREVEAGRGSPHGGVYLSFEHCSADTLRAAFGPVIDRLAANGIDLTRMPVEVAPIAHYHMGGLRVDATMQTCVAGLYAAGEAVGGANGANRLSGNAITEALAFGRLAGSSAAVRAAQSSAQGWTDRAAEPAIARVRSEAVAAPQINLPLAIVELQSLMADEAGPLRNAGKLTRALARVTALRDAIGAQPPHAGAFDARRLDWLDLDNMLLTAEAVARAALARTESRGAHQREDHPAAREDWRVNQLVRLREGALAIERAPVVDAPETALAS